MSGYRQRRPKPRTARAASIPRLPEIPPCPCQIPSSGTPKKDKPYKLADERGLCLLVKPVGKYWRLDYRVDGKRKTLAPWRLSGCEPQGGPREARRSPQTNCPKDRPQRTAEGHQNRSSRNLRSHRPRMAWCLCVPVRCAARNGRSSTLSGPNGGFPLPA